MTGRIVVLEDVLDEMAPEPTFTRCTAGPPKGILTEKQYNREQQRRRNRSKQLLLSLLDDNQRWYLRYRGVIPVVSNLGERWRICCNTVVANVCRDSSKRGYCALLQLPPYREIPYWSPEYGLMEGGYFMPWADHWIAQMLTLQTDQAKFIRTAHCYHPWQHLTGLPGDKGNRIEVIWY